MLIIIIIIYYQQPWGRKAAEDNNSSDYSIFGGRMGIYLMFREINRTQPNATEAELCLKQLGKNQT